MTKEKWYYNELLHTGVDYSSVEEVRRYDDRMGRLRDIRTEIETVINALRPEPDSVILEIGSGTGEFAIALAKQCRRLCAVDVSPVMLDYAREKARVNNINNIEFHTAGFLTFEHAGEPFDHIYSQLALHHLPDFWKLIGLKRIHSLLKPGGKFFLKDVVYPANVDDFDVFFAEIIKEVEDSAGPEFTKEYYGHISREFSTLDWIMKKLLTDAGFTILHSALEKKFLATYLCTG